jgi:hypothetical protein
MDAETGEKIRYANNFGPCHLETQNDTKYNAKWH